MKGSFLLPLAALALAFPLAARQPADRAEIGPLLERIAALEIEIQHLLRYATTGLDPAAVRAHVRRIGEGLRLPSFDMTALPAPADAPPGFAIEHVALSGRGPWADVARLFLLAADPAAIEEIRISAASGENVEFAGTLAFVRFTGFQPASPPSGNVIRDVQAALSDREGALAVVRELARAAAEGPRALASLDAFMTAADPYAVALTSARIGKRTIELEGFLFGAATAERVTEPLKKASGSEPAISVTEGGGCRPFRIVSSVAGADRAVGGSEPHPLLTAGDGIFDLATAVWCSDESTGERKRVVAGSEAGATPMVRLRGVTLAHVFQVLNDLIAGGFVIDPDVQGRVDVDFHDDSTLEEIFERLAAAGAHAGPPPLRIVRARPDTKPLLHVDAAGARVSFQLSNAAIASVLCAAAQVLEREVWIPSGLTRRVSVFVEDQPIDLTVARLAASAGLVAHTDRGRVELRREKSTAESVNACSAAAGESASRLVRRIRGVADLAAADVRLAGLTRVGSDWTAYVQLPGGRLAKLDAGTRLADGQVIAIGPRGVTILAGSQRREVSLPE